MIASVLARALGVDRHAPPAMIVQYLARQSGPNLPDHHVPDHAALWLVGLAVELGQWLPDAGHLPQATRPLGDIATSVAKEHVRSLHRCDAPFALSVVAPDQVVPACRAKDLCRVCRGLVARHLPGFCRQVLVTWQQDGHLPPDRDLGAEDLDL